MGKRIVNPNTLDTILLHASSFDDLAIYKQYDLICYNKKIYNIYKSIYGDRDLTIEDRVEEKNLNSVCDAINNAILSTGVQNRYKECVEDFRTVINSVSLDRSKNLQSKGNKIKQYQQKVFDVNGNDVAYNDLIYEIGSLMSQIWDKLDENDLKRLVNVAKKAGKLKKGKIYDFTEGLGGWLNSLIDKFTEFTDIGVHTQNIDIYPMGSVTYKQLGQAVVKPLQEMIKKGRINANNIPQGYSGLQQKIDNIITYNGESYTVSMKSHWATDGQQPVTIQGSAQKLLNLFSLANIYGVGVSKDLSYWMFLNDALYGNMRWTVNKIKLVYASYFGNVDFLGEWYTINQNNELLPQLALYSKNEIIEYLFRNNKIKLEGQGTFELWINFKNQDISHNEQLVLNNVRVAALTDLSLRAIRKI